MAWKKDEEGHFVADANGNPIWTTDSGEDKAVDYTALTKRISEVNAESQGRKEKLRALNEKLAIFDGIEDLAAWHKEALESIEFRKNAPDKDKELKEQLDSRVEAAIAAQKAQIEARDKTIVERDKTIAEMDSTIRNMAITADVRESKILAERIKPEFRPLLQREMMRAGAMDDEKKIFYRRADGNPHYGEDGSYATREEAPLMLLKELGIDAATVLMSQDDASGSGGNPPQGGSGGTSRKKYADCKTTEERAAWLKNENNLKFR